MPVMVTTVIFSAPAGASRVASPAAGVRARVRGPIRATPGAGAGRSTDLVRGLNAEWSRLLEQPMNAVSARRWAGSQQALAGAQTLRDVEHLAAGPDGDEVLAALLRLAQGGDRLASRTVLQLQLGSVVKLALRTCHYAAGDLQEAKARAVSYLCEAIAAYPLPRRRGRHSTSLALDVLNRLTSHADTRPGRAVRQAELIEVPQEDLLQSLADRAEPVGEPDPSGEVLELLRWAVRRGVLSDDDASLLQQLHTSNDGRRELAQAAVARQLGISHAALRQRSSRATRRLAEAVQRERGLSVGGRSARAVGAA